MNLKKHFVNTLEVLISNDPACDIHTKYYCTKEYDCESYNCRECNSKHKIGADVIFTSIDEEYCSYYVFNKEDVRDFIITIDTEEKMYSELARLNENYINKSDRFMLECYRMIERLQEYADEFAREINDKYLPIFNSKILPIQFVLGPKYENNKDNELLNDIHGRYHNYKNQNIIRVYD